MFTLRQWGAAASGKRPVFNKRATKRAIGRALAAARWRCTRGQWLSAGRQLAGSIGSARCMAHLVADVSGALTVQNQSLYTKPVSFIASDTGCDVSFLQIILISVPDSRSKAFVIKFRIFFLILRRMFSKLA